MKLKEMEKVKILGKTYDIIWTSQAETGEILQGKIGVSIPSLNRIYIDNTIPESQQIDAFFHEFLESVDEELELKLEHGNISRLACAITALLLDNSDNLIFEKE